MGAWKAWPRGIAAALSIAFALGFPVRALAHDIPNSITVYGFLKPEGQRLHLLMRVPFSALIDVDWPRGGPDRLDVARAEPLLTDAATLWLGDNLTLYEEGRALAYPQVARVRASVFADRSFESYEAARASLDGPRLDDSVEVSVKGAFLDVRFDYIVQSDRSRFSIEPRFGRLGIRTATVLRFLPPDGTVRLFEVDGNPGLIRLEPRWYQAARHFVTLGFRDLLGTVGALLFLVCLVLPVVRSALLLPVVLAYIAAHSITLAAYAYNLAPNALWFPPLIDTLFAVSILYVALDNIWGAGLERRWMVAFASGLIHGFSFALHLAPSLQFAGSHFLLSLLSFNAGIELATAVVVAFLVPVAWLLFRFVVAERMAIIIISALVGHSGWHWMIERWRLLSRFQFGWPELTPAFLASVLRWLMVAVAITGVMWLANLLLKARRSSASEPFRPSTP